MDLKIPVFEEVKKKILKQAIELKLLCPRCEFLIYTEVMEPIQINYCTYIFVTTKSSIWAFNKVAR